MGDMKRDGSTEKQSGQKSLFSLPSEVRNLIYEYLLLSPLPLPPTPPQSEQHVHTAILRASRRTYFEANDVLYGRNFFVIHLRSTLHKVAYEPFLSALTVLNASKIKELEIVLWGNYNEDNGDTVSFGTNNFCIALQNLIYARKLVISIDTVKTKIEAEDEEPCHSSMYFCAFDWLMATFANEWFSGKTYFDLFRALARFHMKRIFFDRQVQTCESRWFSEARATPSLCEREHKRLWELEERYGLPHEEVEDTRPDDDENEGAASEIREGDVGTEEDGSNRKNSQDHERG
jgi:hypothetical protein